MKYTKNDEAVSPVIGVILMVAITVILAAVIAAFVFGMAGNIKSTKSVAATAQLINDGTNTNIVVTYQGGPDNGLLATTGTPLVATINDGPFDTPFSASATVGSTATTEKSAVAPSKDHVVVVATFNDGSQQVILDTQV
jgi:flagellin-like protein